MSSLALDHVAVVARDLDHAQTTYARLGFALTPRSLHSGSIRADRPVEPWGSANHCAIFADGYLEVLGVSDPALYSTVPTLLERYQGAHTVALRCADADAAFRALRERKAVSQAPRALQRLASYGAGEDERRLAAFRNIYLDTEEHPEARFILTEHVTPEVIWQPHLLTHANGARSLEAAWLCSSNPARAAASIAKVAGVEPFLIGPGHLRFPLARGTLELVTRESLDAFAPGLVAPAAVFVAGFDLAVADLTATAAFLARRGFAVNRSEGAVWVAPEETCGACVRFIAARQRGQASPWARTTPPVLELSKDRD